MRAMESILERQGCQLPSLSLSLYWREGWYEELKLRIDIGLNITYLYCSGAWDRGFWDLVCGEGIM